MKLVPFVLAAVAVTKALLSCAAPFSVVDGQSNVTGVLSDVQHLVARGTVLGKLADHLGDTADAGVSTSGHEAFVGDADVLPHSPTSTSSNTSLESLQQRLRSNAGEDRGATSSRARASRGSDNSSSSSSSSSSDSDSGSSTSQRMAKAYKAHNIALGKAVAAPSPVSLTHKSLQQRLEITGGHPGASTSRLPDPDTSEHSSSDVSSDDADPLWNSREPDRYPSTSEWSAPPRPRRPRRVLRQPGYQKPPPSDNHSTPRPSDSSSLVSSSDHSNSASRSSWDSEHGAAQRWDDKRGWWVPGNPKTWDGEVMGRLILHEHISDQAVLRKKPAPVIPSGASESERKIMTEDSDLAYEQYLKLHAQTIAAQQHYYKLRDIFSAAQDVYTKTRLLRTGDYVKEEREWRQAMREYLSAVRKAEKLSDAQDQAYMSAARPRLVSLRYVRHRELQQAKLKLG